MSVSLSHYFDFHFLACMPWDPVAKSPGPISFFSFSSTISFQKHLKGQLHRLAVVEGVGPAASKIPVGCDRGEERQQGLGEGVGSSRRGVSEQGRGHLVLCHFPDLLLTSRLPSSQPAPVKRGEGVWLHNRALDVLTLGVPLPLPRLCFTQTHGRRIPC